MTPSRGLAIGNGSAPSRERKYLANINCQPQRLLRQSPAPQSRPTQASRLIPAQSERPGTARPAPTAPKPRITGPRRGDPTPAHHALSKPSPKNLRTERPPHPIAVPGGRPGDARRPEGRYSRKRKPSLASSLPKHGFNLKRPPQEQHRIHSCYNRESEIPDVNHKLRHPID